MAIKLRGTLLLVECFEAGIMDLFMCRFTGLVALEQVELRLCNRLSILSRLGRLVAVDLLEIRLSYGLCGRETFMRVLFVSLT